KSLVLVVVALPACILGMVPALYWGYKNRWANFIYIGQLGDVKTIDEEFRLYYHSRLALIKDEVYLYKTYVAPRVISGALPTESPTLSTIHFFTLRFGLFCIVATSLLVVLSFVWRSPWLVRIRQLGLLPLLFAICTALIFCTSTASAVGLVSFEHDLAGRYATPLVLALPFFFATVFTMVSMGIYTLGRASKKVGIRDRAGTSPRATARVAPTIHGLRIPVPLSISYRSVLSFMAQGLLLVFLVVYLGVQASTFGLTDPDATYQSPSCPIAPAYNDPIIAYLQHEHVHYAWAVSWISYPILFKTNGGIILADPRPL